MFKFLAYLLLWQTISAEWTERREEVIHPDGKYVVGWTVDFNSSTIIFDVLAETTGYVGFGLSTNGGMAGADIVIGGLHPNGSVYFADLHGIGPQPPIVDESQDWRFIMGYDNTTHTYLRFSRILDTCDLEDIAITSGSLHLIWAMGRTDDIAYHDVDRGSYAVNLLDPAFPDVDLSEFLTYNITINMTMPSKPTTYWCSVHRGPSLQKKHQIVGFQAKLESAMALAHTHHANIYKCTAPEGEDPDEFFGPYVDHPGGECYSSPDVPIRECGRFIYVWAKGGRRFLLPEHVGYPIAETTGNEYYMIEVHYDNPQQLAQVQFETGITVYYTDVIRQNDAGILMASHDASVSLTVPPRTSNFTIVGHCDSDCTSKYLPTEGVNIFNVLLHSHLSGRKARLRHFRENTELPWIANDDNYNFDYQQNRPLMEEIKFFPGDHLSYECNYDTNWKERAEVTIGGLSTHEEMCESFIWYYPKSDLRSCISAYPLEKLYQKFGILEAEYDWGNGLTEPIIISPPEMANMTYSEALNTVFQWSDSIKEELKREVRYDSHESYCFGTESTFGFTTYPTVDQEYGPISECTK